MEHLIKSIIGAREFLELDVAAGVSDSIPLAQLQQTQPEYKPFDKRPWTKAGDKEKSKQRERRRIKRRDQL
jgi:hypothetical protein